jgi:hypothetical protein
VSGPMSCLVHFKPDLIPVPFKSSFWFRMAPIRASMTLVRVFDSGSVFFGSAPLEPHSGTSGKGTELALKFLLFLKRKLNLLTAAPAWWHPSPSPSRSSFH